jgi:hypothetical protein
MDLPFVKFCVLCWGAYYLYSRHGFPVPSRVSVLRWVVITKNKTKKLTDRVPDKFKKILKNSHEP